MDFREKRQIRWIILSGILMLIGLAILKYIPMEIFGKDILFDASAHVVFAGFVFYVLWFFIDQNKSWRMPYLILSFSILIVISVQRILRGKHNDIGLILGFLVLFLGIVIPRWKEFWKKLDF